MKRIFPLLIAYCLLISSCKKEELPVPAHNSGNVITATVNMNVDYRYQLFYDLKTNTVLSQNLKTAWDLGFETSASGYRIILNSSKAMYAYNTGNSNFTSVTDTSGLSAGKKYDTPSGNRDSTAIGNWQTLNSVYIIDRGYSYTGAHQGFRKIIFQSADNNKYTTRFSNVNGTGDTTITITKDSEYNFSFLSFNTNSTLIIEPPKANWDLSFTQYLETLSTPYLVTGCLLNRFNTSAKMDSLILFSSIDFSFAQTQTLSSNINTIGYKWKIYNVSFTVLPHMNYIIKDSEGFFYKLHFIDFYDTGGNKGNPKWEQQKL